MEFKVGDIVQLRADPSVSGAVIQFLPGEPENRFVLFHGDRTTTYYSSQLQPKEEAAGTPDLLSPSKFRARLSALQIRQPSLSSLYSLHAARVNFVPYQFRPVLKFIRSDRPRLLIADEVGVGKTIEAGLILRELQSRRDVHTVLVICPKPLVTERKWELELQRFDEQFAPLDGPMLRHCITETDLNGVWPDRQSRAILPFSLFDERLLNGDQSRKGRRSLGLLDLDPPPRFDLVIVDEAHHLRNPSTFLHQGVRFFCDHAEAVLFLTATPIQLDDHDLFVLMNLLRPDVILDPDTFRTMAGPNPFLNAAVDSARAARSDWNRQAIEDLDRAGETAWGRAILKRNPEFRQVRTRLSQETIPPPERLALIRELENLHTFSHLINRTRRRDIGSFTTRKVESVEVSFTQAQAKLHDALLAAQAGILRRKHGDRHIRFMLTTLRRQAASCLYGLAPLIRGILERGMSEVEWEEADDAWEEIGEEASASLRVEIAEVLGMAERLERHDPKLDALKDVILQKQHLPNNKILVFSSFLHTLRYLQKHLGLGIARTGLIHGGVPDDVRRTLRDRFSRPPEDPTAIDLLFSSEVGCEGLDYQFCNCLANYDLPWNPMRVEQRIGRIDRYGQQSPTVAIYNFVTPGTVDAEIYNRCLLRIGVFRQALGGSEEVLGKLTREIRAVAENLELTPEEGAVALQQIADNEIRRMQEQAELEERQAELFGILLPPEHMEREVKDASSTWLTPTALQNLVRHYLTERAGGEGHILGDPAIKTLRLNQEARSRLLEDYQQLPRQASPVYRRWERWLKDSTPFLEITFETEAATQNREVTLVNPIHPLVQQAATLAGVKTSFRTVCRVVEGAVSPGRYPFAVYQWRQIGVREDARLVPICKESSLSDEILRLLEGAEAASSEEVAAFPSKEVFDALEGEHYRLWSKARALHQEETQRIARYRRESIRTSHESRMALLREQSAQSTNEKIRRMRKGQMENAETDYARRVAEIEEAERRADILSQVVAYGLLIVEEK